MGRAKTEDSHSSISGAASLVCYLGISIEHTIPDWNNQSLVPSMCICTWISFTTMWRADRYSISEQKNGGPTEYGYEMNSPAGSG